MRIILALAFCVAGAGAAMAEDGWPESCRLTRIAELPMDLKQGHISVPVTVNGMQKTFDLDTGGFATGLSGEAVAQMKLPKHPINAGMRISDAGGKQSTEFVRSDTFGFGTMLGKHLPLLVMDGLGDTDGLLAPDYLRNFDVELDFAVGKVEIYRHHPCRDYVVYWAGRYSELSFGTTEDGHIRVPVTLDGHETHAIIDTGAPVSVISLRTASSLFNLKLDSIGMTKASQMGGAGGSVFDTYTYPFQTLTLGGVTVSHPKVRVADTLNMLGGLASLVVGLSIVQKLHVYIAYGDGKMYVTGADAH